MVYWPGKLLLIEGSDGGKLRGKCLTLGLLSDTLERETMNLGKEQKDTGPVALAVPGESKEPKVVYPDFCVRDEAATKLLDAYPCSLGDEIAATVLLKVTALREDEYGKSVTFEVREVDDMTEESEEKEGSAAEEANESPEDEAEEQALGYKRTKVKKEAPTMGAKDLE